MEDLDPSSPASITTITSLEICKKKNVHVEQTSESEFRKLR